MRTLSYTAITIFFISVSAWSWPSIDLPNAKTAQNQVQNSDVGGGGGVVKSTLDRLDQVQANLENGNQVMDGASLTLRDIARNSAAGKELDDQMKTLEAEKTKAKSEDAKKAVEEKKQALIQKENEFWSNSVNLTELKKQQLSGEQRTKLVQLSAELGTAAITNKSTLDNCQQLAKDIPQASQHVKDDIKNPLQAARSTKRLAEAPATLKSIESQATGQAKRIAVFSEATKMLLAEK